MIGLPAARLTAPPARAQSGTQSGLGPAQRFGLIGVGSHQAEADALGAGWEQVTFDWAAFQPGGPQDFVAASINADALQAAAEAGREVVGLIVQTPAWASDSGQPDGVPRGLDLPLRDPGNTWAAFVTRLADTYAPLGVHRWIIYDEPDIKVGEGRVSFAGTVTDYAKLLKIAYLAAQAVDPDAAIHLGALNWWADVSAGREPYLSRLLAELKRDPDAPVYHYFFSTVMLRVFDTTSTVWDVVTATRAILNKAELADKTIWLETNASPTLDPIAGISASIFGITPDQQADFMVQAAALGLAAGADRIAVRLVDDPRATDPWGLIRANGFHRPAFDAYRRVIVLFAAVQTAARYTLPDADLVILSGPDHDVYVMWAHDAAPVQFIITSPVLDEPAALYDAYLTAQQVKSGPDEWPAAFVIDCPTAQRDAHGFLTVAGAPRVLVLDKTSFFRVIYGIANGKRARLK